MSEVPRLEQRPEAKAFAVETLLQYVRDGKIRPHTFESVTSASFKRLAAVSGVNFATVQGWVREAVQRAREAWHLHAQELPFLAAERQRLEAHMARVPLLTAS